MRPEIKKTLSQPPIIATLCLAGLAVILLGYQWRQNRLRTYAKDFDELSYQNLIKPEDQAPLPPPKPGKSLLLPILMYHHIGYPPENAGPVRKGLTVAPQDFAAQAKWISQQGYQTVSLQQFYDFTHGQAVTWPAKPIIFTFDDGYQDAFDNAIPVLKQYGFDGSFAIITSYPSQKQGDNFYASWQRIVQAKGDGMEIVCHTQNHFFGKNPKYSADYIYQNLSGCQKDITDHLGSAEPFLVYPYGAYTDSYLEQAKKAGFVMGLTIHFGRDLDLDNLMTLPRVRVSGGDSLETVIKNLTGKKLPDTAATSTRP